MFTLVKSAFCTYAFFTKKQWNDVSTVTFHYTYSKEVHCWLTNKYHVNKEGRTTPYATFTLAEIFQFLQIQFLQIFKL